MKTVYAGGTGELVEKKSRFIAHIESVSSEDEAVKFIADMKKQYFDARHNCYAFVIGPSGELTRCSDDGEPSGTAGRPMLEVLLGEGITDVVCVVTRYFGGTLLGTGGLVRAYQGAVKEGINNSVIIEKLPGIILLVSCDYTDVGRLQYTFSAKGIRVLDSVYEDRVTFKIVCDISDTDLIKKDLTEITSGKALITEDKKCMYADIDGKTQIY